MSIFTKIICNKRHKGWALARMLHLPIHIIICICITGWWYMLLNYEVMNDIIFYINALIYSIKIAEYTEYFE